MSLMDECDRLAADARRRLNLPKDEPKEPSDTALYAKALKQLPKCCIGTLDQHHTTIEDLVWIVQHEVDLYEDGEENDIANKRQLNQCRRYIERWSEQAHRETE